MTATIPPRRGSAWCFGDNVDTDQMAPLNAMQLTPAERRPMLFPKHPGVAAQIAAGDIVVAGRNWGCGSSREHAPQNLIELGVAAVVAESFARIYFRNSIALGFPALACPGISLAVVSGDEVEVDLVAAVVRNITRGTEHPATPYTPMMIDIVSQGGLLASVARRLGVQGETALAAPTSRRR